MAGILDRKRAMSDDHDPIALLTGGRDQNRRARQIGMGHLTKRSGIRMAICPPATATPVLGLPEQMLANSVR